MQAPICLKTTQLSIDNKYTVKLSTIDQLLMRTSNQSDENNSILFLLPRIADKMINTCYTTLNKQIYHNL